MRKTDAKTNSKGLSPLRNYVWSLANDTKRMGTMQGAAFKSVTRETSSGSGSFDLSMRTSFLLPCPP